MSIKKILFTTVAFSTMFIALFSLSSCCENEGGNEESLKPVEIELVKQTREELIINRDTIAIADWNNMSDFEKKHTPEIVFGGIDEKGYGKIFVTVGSAGIVHPSTEEHWIDFMTLYINDKEYRHIEIKNVEGSNLQEFFAPLKAGDIVKVVLGCNLHGIWESSTHFE